LNQIIMIIIVDHDYKYFCQIYQKVFAKLYNNIAKSFRRTALPLVSRILSYS